MSRRKTGAIAAIPLAAVLLWGLQACSSNDRHCAAPTPTPALRMAPAKPTTQPTSRTTRKPPHAWPRKTTRTTTPVRPVIIVDVDDDDDCD